MIIQVKVPTIRGRPEGVCICAFISLLLLNGKCVLKGQNFMSINVLNHSTVNIMGRDQVAETSVNH